EEPGDDAGRQVQRLDGEEPGPSRRAGAGALREAGDQQRPRQEHRQLRVPHAAVADAAAGSARAGRGPRRPRSGQAARGAAGFSGSGQAAERRTLMRRLLPALALAPALALFVGCASSPHQAVTTEPVPTETAAVAEAKLARDPGGFTVTQNLPVPGDVRRDYED